MKYSKWLIILLVGVCFSCKQKQTKKKIVYAIPVYGQSLALGEEAIRITNLDSLAERTHNRIVTENLDYDFGYLSDTHFKQWLKKLLNDRRRAFELSIYGMSELVSDSLNKGQNDSLMICTFPGGQGATSIVGISKGSRAYKKFLREIEKANEKAQDKGWEFIVPAFCWMQGEDDIVWHTSKNYKRDLKRFQTDLNMDVKAITGQTRDVVCISYQTNCLTLSKDFNQKFFHTKETAVSQGQMELVRDDSLFMASGPTYPYSFASELVHIDGVSQKRLGYHFGLSVIRLLKSQPSRGLTPGKIEIIGNNALVSFNVSTPPLILDTVEVWKASNYGFSVIDSAGNDILEKIILQENNVLLQCKSSPSGSRIKYAVNGVKGKSGYKHGPRGNLRDSQGKTLIANIQSKNYPLHNWCYQFDIVAK